MHTDQPRYKPSLQMNGARMEKNIAVTSIVLAIIHFFIETIWHFKVGQFLPMLIVDYIAVSLLIYAGWRSIQTGQGAGLLCGAWGFTFCLNYRSLFWRVNEFLQGNASAGVTEEMYFLSFCFVITACLFAMTLYLANPKKNG